MKKKERKKEKENGKIKGQKKSDFFFMPSWIIVYGSLGGLKGIKRRIDARKSRGGGSGGGGGEGGGRGGGGGAGETRARIRLDGRLNGSGSWGTMERIAMAMAFPGQRCPQRHATLEH